MSRMFSSSAELTEIAESANGLFVSNIVQKAGISVTEMGTVAYAATGKYKTVTSLLRPNIWDGWKRIQSSNNQAVYSGGSLGNYFAIFLLK